MRPLGRSLLVATLLLAVPAAGVPASASSPLLTAAHPTAPSPTMPSPTTTSRAAAVPGTPQALSSVVAQGRKAIAVSWAAPTTGETALGYRVTLDGRAVGTTTPEVRSLLIEDGLVLGRTYRIGVAAYDDAGTGREVRRKQTLYLAPVTTVQTANPANPLAGRDWGVYLGNQDPAIIGWQHLDQKGRDRYAPIAMVQKAKWFGNWIKDRQAKKKTSEYVRDTQDGDPSRMTFLSLFRMFPWEGTSSIKKRLPTQHEQASYRAYVRGVAAGIGSSRVTVVVQPDGYFVKAAFQSLKRKVGARRALLPTRMLAWTTRVLSRQPNTTVYVDMGSEDWARGDVHSVAKYLKLSGVAHARGFSLNVTHANYLDREIVFARKVSLALGRMGVPGKHAVLDTSDNGHPFSGAEINGPGHPYTPPADIGPCRTKTQKKVCTALGVPPTTDVDNPAWGLSSSVAKIAAEYVDAYLWVDRPWLPEQGAGGTRLSLKYAGLLQKTWPFSPYFTGTP